MQGSAEVQTIYAFCDGDAGGNAAGVLIADALPEDATMQRVAAEVGHPETVFAAPQDGGWRVRYFAPQMEVPFCGHATIALGAALARNSGNGTYTLNLNRGTVTVEGTSDASGLHAALHSPPTASVAPSEPLLTAALELFGFTHSDLDSRIPPAIISAGATHLALTLRSRQTLRDMHYDFERGRSLMQSAGLITIVLAFAESPQLFYTRNPFAVGGIYEDPATGSGTAAFAGYLRDVHWPHGGQIEVIQGEDMGSRSRLHATIPAQPGTSIRVAGRARIAGSQSVLLD